MYEFDIKQLLQVIKSKKKMLIGNCVVAAVLAVVVGYSIPKEYSSDSVLASEAQSSSSLGGSAASLASLAGIKMGSSEDAISPNLYPNVVSSNEFIVDILGCQVETADGSFKGSYMDYLSDHQKSAWWTYPFALVRSLIGSLSGSGKEEKMGSAEIDPLHLSPSVYGLVGAVRSNVICSTDDEDGTVMIKAHAQDAQVAKTLVDSATIKLQELITAYRTNKARVDLKYYQTLEKDALAAYRKAQEKFANFQDSHRNIQMQSYINEQQSLENDVQLAFTAYSQMKQQVLMAMAKVQEKTPVFTVIEGASVPVLPDAPKKKLILVAFLFVAFVGSLGWIYFKLLFFHKEEKQQ